MAISRISSAVGTTTLTMPTRAVGDLEIFYAFRDGNITAPTLPAGVGLLSIATLSGTSCSYRAGFRWCVDAADTSGTWTNATHLICVIYRGCLGIGPVGTNSGSSTTMAYLSPGSFAQNAGNSWAVGFGSHRTATDVEGGPSGMTNVTSTGSGPESALHDTNGGVASWSDTNDTVNQNAAWVTGVIELLADKSTWTPYRKGSTITLSNGQLTATTSAPGADGASAGGLVRSVGKYVFAVTASDKASAGYAIGFGNPNISLTAALGATTTTCVWNPDGTVVLNASTLSTISSYTNGNLLYLAIDFDNMLFWGRVGTDGLWNNSLSANPDNGTGGVNISTISHSLGLLIARDYLNGGGAETSGYILDGTAAGHGLSRFTTWDGVAPSVGPTSIISPIAPIMHNLLR